MKRLLYTLSIAIFLFSCGDNKPSEQELKAKFEKHHKAYTNAKDIEQISTAVDSILAAVSVYEKNYPESIELNNMFFVAGMTCFNSDADKAIDYFTKASSSKYDGIEGSKQAEALYHIGRVYHEVKNDTKSARDAYREVINRFPEGTWSDISKASLEDLAKFNMEKIDEATMGVDTTSTEE